MIRIFEAFTGRRLAANARKVALAANPAAADARAELADAHRQLAASQGEVRRLLAVIQERDKTLAVVQEDAVRLRAANALLAERANRPSPWHPRVEVAPRDPDEALTRRAAQDRRNCIALQDRVLELEAIVEALRAGVPA